ncbi:hypothetical protein K461DRAFT_293131 [Myriangium duriaei CBS 260.36]|uniref:Phytocyanin domain-containing protein n=1 Tax=Myriangium duriaei CBS 260.36 TaxID=1168546 RepID=A0A9P4J8Y6_9PEZI|nr:hypothetical protein K461DRAFT_293131 [Myriangium duriaei CBS 260.36]
MSPSTQSLLLLAFVTLTQSTTTFVKVANAGLAFEPSSVTAAVGDQIIFDFVHGNHAVTQGDFSNACQPKGASGFNSGVVTKSGSVTWTITVNSTDPIYYYCPVANHCQQGMAGAINAPTAQSAANYIANSKNSKSSGEESAVQGGTFGTTSAASGSSGSSSISTATGGATSSSAGSMATGGSTTASLATGTTSSSSTASASASAGAADTVLAPALLAVPIAFLAAL